MLEDEFYSDSHHFMVIAASSILMADVVTL